MKRTVWVAALLALVLAATACSTSGDGEDGGGGGTDPEATTTTAAGPAPTGDPGAGADVVVWQESTGGGFVPTQSAAAEVPAVTIYADGRIFTATPDDAGRYDHPARVTAGQVEPDALEEFLADAGATGVFEPGVDFGAPGITDQASTTVTLRAGDPPTTITVYALGFEAPAGGGVSAAQAGRRSALTDLLAEARILGNDPGAWVPDRVRATAFGPTDDFADRPFEPEMWPGPPFSEFPADTDGDLQTCLVIEGDDAATVYEAALSNDGTDWSDDGEIRQVVVAPLLPGQEGCPPS